MRISLKEFLQTGRLGELRIGMAVQEVLALLGTPDTGDSTLQSEQGSFWQYGTFTVSFGNEYNQLEGLASIEWAPPLGNAHLPASCQIEDWDITADMLSADVKTYLRSNGFSFQKRSTKVYYQKFSAKKMAAMRAEMRDMPPDMEEYVLSKGHLVFKKPKEEADLVRTSLNLTYFLPSEVRIQFVDNQFLHIGIFEFLK